MILHGFWRSTATWRVRIVLGWKGLAYEYRSVNLRSGEGEQHLPAYRELNPMRQVPLLETVERDEATGSERRVHLGQSLAIAEYLEERFPAPPLLPADRLARARVRQIAETVNSGIQPLQNTSVQRHLREVIGADEAAWCRHWVSRGLEALEALVAPLAGRFAVGDAPTLADVCIVPQLHFARRFGLEPADHRTLARIEAACAPLDAFAQARPERQPDAEPAAPPEA